MNFTMTWGISALAVLGVVIRPFGWPEAMWALTGAILLTAFGLIGYSDAWAGIAKGLDVYLFLTGMMLLSELARQEGLFDWLASVATSQAKGSPKRLFVLTYAVGVVTTVFLSNDATSVVLTPAVYAASRAANVKNPIPYLLICAFIANAASFVLPISNPANLVIFGNGDMPPLSLWLAIFTLPSIAAIVVTFLALYWTQRSALAGVTITSAPKATLSVSARLTGIAITVTAVIMLASSTLGWDLGMPTFVAGVLATISILVVERKSPVTLLRNISWSVLPLVGGLFVIVAAIEQTGVVEWLARQLSGFASNGQNVAIVGAGVVVALVSNVINNLPAGLLAGEVVHAANVGHTMSAAVLIGVDLGPNLSVTGSLATILWLNALRREGLYVSAWQFLRLGMVVMTPALVCSLVILVLQ